jgi:hypothetical protein
MSQGPTFSGTHSSRHNAAVKQADPHRGATGMLLLRTRARIPLTSCILRPSETLFFAWSYECTREVVSVLTELLNGFRLNLVLGSTLKFGNPN